MTTVTLYRYEREPGRITISPEKPDCEHTTLYRLIADEGMMLVNEDGDSACAVDVYTPEEWREVIEKGEDDYDEN